MKIIELDDKIIVQNAESFNLESTLDCGQCFRWKKAGKKFHGIAFGKEIFVHFDENNLIIENSNLLDFNNIWKNYFDLNTNYELITEELKNFNDLLKSVCENTQKIRILKQDFWEALCSFIISQNNNIPRIKKIINSLCENFGEKIGKNNSFSFPSAKILSNLTVEDLSIVKSGFRAKYIIDAAKKVASGMVEPLSLKQMSMFNAKSVLMTINGVGSKVAECALLYGLGRLEAFPLDVWMKKIMEKFFAGKSPKFFGQFAGVAQQHLYYYFRMNPQNLIKT